MQPLLPSGRANKRTYAHKRTNKPNTYSDKEDFGSHTFTPSRQQPAEFSSTDPAPLLHMPTS
jgi:hypothetical protein